MLENETLLISLITKLGVDTRENGPSTFWIVNTSSRISAPSTPPTPGVRRTSSGDGLHRSSLEGACGRLGVVLEPAVSAYENRSKPSKKNFLKYNVKL